MYAPFLPQLIIVIIHFVLFVTATVLNACEKKKVVKYIYSIVMVVVICLNIVLLFSAAMGVGASGYD